MKGAFLLPFRGIYGGLGGYKVKSKHQRRKGFKWLKKRGLKI
jgi:hypothetical protein